MNGKLAPLGLNTQEISIAAMEWINDMVTNAMSHNQIYSLLYSALKEYYPQGKLLNNDYDGPWVEDVFDNFEISDCVIGAASIELIDNDQCGRRVTPDAGNG